MELTRAEVEVIEIAVAEASGVLELTEMQLALVGGGCGETIL